jgi:succinoglycan biosynthesis protein ExoM
MTATIGERGGAASEGAVRSAERIEQVDICICTYKRPSLIETLAAVAAQTDLSDVRYRVIIADNAADPSARAQIVEAGDKLGLDLLYVHAPKQNISVARNACLAAASAPWIAFLDDDETPTPGWLRALIDEAERGGLDAIQGPVEAVYAAGTPVWLSQSALHSTRPVWVNGEIVTGYTGNVLLRRAAIEGLSFRSEFGRSGGEDNDFFYRFVARGGRIGFTEQAIVYEPVPPARASLAWLLKRSFRSGQTHGSHLKGAGVSAPAAMVVTAGKFVACLGLAVLSMPKPDRGRRQLVRAALHWGVVARLAGVREIQMY